MASLKKLKQTTAQWGYLHRSANGQLLRLKKSAEEMDKKLGDMRKKKK
ncbi:hypothetical protein [Blautia hydrogenotrophica]|nr:hypothetical protein [Blautia hydrogenotrophica]MEE0462411.1 hypothetical protein [Blautia hydrogenotrophica]